MSNKIKLTRKLLYTLFIVENKSVPDISSILGISRSTIQRRLKAYNIKKSAELITQSRMSKFKETVNTPEYKKKISEIYKNSEKRKLAVVERKVNFKPCVTKLHLQQLIEEGLCAKEISDKLNINRGTLRRYLKFYNLNIPLENSSSSRKKTNLQKYGVPFAQQNETVKDKQRSTSMQNWGAPNFLSSEEGKKKITYFLKMHNISNVSQLPNWKSKVSKTNLKKYQVPFQVMRYSVNKSKVSKINLEWKEYLGLTENDLEKTLGFYSYDLIKKNILIEINPTFTHCDTRAKYFNPKTQYMHQKKTLFAMQQGFRCLTIWDWDKPSKVKAVFNEEKIEIEASTCKLLKVTPDVARNFVLKNYLVEQPLFKYQRNLGLMYNNTLIALMCFSNEGDWVYECYCEDIEYKVLNGCITLFNTFIKLFNPRVVYTYCNLDKFNGNTERFLGFKEDSIIAPQKHWFEPKNKILLQETDSLKDYELHNFYDIWDCGKIKFRWSSGTP